jgi:hypothetical protein
METKRLLLRGLLGLGILLTCSPVLLALPGMIFGMWTTYQAVTVNGLDPSAASAGMAETLVLSAAGFTLLPVGIVMMIASLIALRSLNRPIPEPLPPPFPPTQG